MAEPQQKTTQTSWHELLGALLYYLLKPLGIEVTVGFPVTHEAPRGDILLLHTQTEQWHEERYAVLPDGVRDSSASHILIEFKYTESLNRKAFLQVLGYDTFYRRSHLYLKEAEIQSFLVSSKTPVQETLDEFGYTLGEHPGVYHSNQVMLRDITLLVLNELRDEPHNAFFKCFASRRKRKQNAFDTLKQSGWLDDKSLLGRFLIGLRLKWFSKSTEDQTMAIVAPSKEEILELGKMWEDSYFDTLTLDTFLAKKQVSTEEVLSRYQPKEVLSRYKPEQRLAGLETEEILSQYKPEEILTRYEPEQRLAGLALEEIEQYLKTLKEKEKKSASQASSGEADDLPLQ